MTTMMMCLLTSSNLTSCPPSHALDTSMKHSHWLNRDQHAPFTIHIIVGLFITTVGVVAAVGNVLVVVTCVRYKDLRTRSNILIINLAVGDLLMCVIDFPLLAIASFLQGWPFGIVVCKMYAFLTAVAGLVTINTLGVISADRYWAVVWRASPRQQLPKYVTGLVVFGVWLYAIAWAICPILGWGDYVLDGIGTTCTFDYLTRSWSNRAFVIAMVFGNFILPFLMMSFSYTKIWLAVCNVKKGLRVAVGYQDSRKGSRNQKLSTTTTEVKVDCSNVCSENNNLNNVFYTGCEGRGKTPSRERTIIHQVVSDKMCMVKETQSENERKVGITVNPLKSPHHKNFIIFRFKKDNYNKDDDRSSLNHIIKCRKAGLGHQIKQCQRYTFTENDKNASPVTKHSTEDNTLLRNQYYFIRSSPANNTVESKKSSTNVFKQFNDSERSHTKVSISSYQKVTSDKVFFKQHRYRLHCEYKTMKIIMYLLFAFIISWFPYVVVSMIGLFGDRNRITYLTSVFPSLVAKSSIVFNPILYSISHPKVRKRIVRLFCSKSSPHNSHNNNNNGDYGTSGNRHAPANFSSFGSYSR